MNGARLLVPHDTANTLINEIESTGTDPENFTAPDTPTVKALDNVIELPLIFTTLVSVGMAC